MTREVVDPCPRRCGSWCGISCCLALVVCLLPSAAVAQEVQSRAEALARERTAKAAALQPYRPGRAERLLKTLEDRPFWQREGPYARIGTLTTGSGTAFGGGYRGQSLFRRHGTLDAWVAASLQSYWATEVRVRFPELADGRLELEGFASRREYPMEDFFGVGPDSRRLDQTDFLSLTTSTGIKGGYRPHTAWLVGGGLDHVDPYIGSGKDEALPSIHTTFDDDSAPGLARQPSFLRSFAFVEVDTRQPRNARRGSFVRIDASHYGDREFSAYTFNRTDLDVRHFMGVFGERRLLVGRAWISTSDARAGQTVPFYLMPTLGGGDSLRGFRQYRFRGPHALLLQGEYRWEIWSALEGALFYDAGKVTTRRADLDLRDLERDYGFGFRFNTNNGVVLRVDAGFGSRDGKHLYIAFGGVF